MNGADILRSEHVRQKCRNGREAAAVHGEDHEKSRLENYPFTSTCQAWNEEKQVDLNDKEHDVCVAAANKVREGCPKESAAGVEQTDDRDYCRGLKRSLLEHVLHHRRGLRQNADTSRHVDEQNAPQQVELHRPERFVPRKLATGDHLIA